jgi:hypothetical protein
MKVAAVVAGLLFRFAALEPAIARSQACFSDMGVAGK